MKKITRTHALFANSRATGFGSMGFWLDGVRSQHLTITFSKTEIEAFELSNVEI